MEFTGLGLEFVIVLPTLGMGPDATCCPAPNRNHPAKVAGAAMSPWQIPLGKAPLHGPAPMGLATAGQAARPGCTIVQVWISEWHGKAPDVVACPGANNGLASENGSLTAPLFWDPGKDKPESSKADHSSAPWPSPPPLSS